MRLRGLRKDYDSAVAVAGLDLDVPRGAFVSLLGPSGCGKTTTLRMVAGLVRPTEGRIFINDRDVTDLPPRKRRLAMVFQQFALFPHLTVAKNVAFGLRMQRIAPKERRSRVQAALELVQMADLAERWPRQLSGGQQQRVAFARAIVVEPDVLLLDEPLSNLDAKLRQSLRDELVVLQRRLGMTSIYVTHDQEEAMSMSQLVAVMHAGRIEQVGTPRELYEHPSSSFVADFIGRTNLIAGDLVEVKPEHGVVRVGGGHLLRTTRAGALEAGALVDVSIRPERVVLRGDGEHEDPAANRLSGVVEATSYIGPSLRLRVRIADDAATVTVDIPSVRAAAPSEGTPVALEVAPEDVVILRRRAS